MKTKYHFKNEESKNTFRNITRANEYIADYIDNNGGYFTLLDYDKFDDPNSSDVVYHIELKNINDNEIIKQRGYSMHIAPMEIHFFEPLSDDRHSKDLLSPGAYVRIIGGRYDGAYGKILSNAWSKRDGDRYKIVLDNSEKIVTISVRYAQIISDIKKEEMKKYIKKYEGKSVIINEQSINNAIELDEDADLLNCIDLNSTRWLHGVCALCTLVFEKHGQIVANVVWEGTYAIIPVKYLEESWAGACKI